MLTLKQTVPLGLVPLLGFLSSAPALAQDDQSQWPDWVTNDYNCVIGCLSGFNDAITSIPQDDLANQAYGCTASTCTGDSTGNYYQTLYYIQLFYATGSIYEWADSAPDGYKHATFSSDPGVNTAAEPATDTSGDSSGDRSGSGDGSGDGSSSSSSDGSGDGSSSTNPVEGTGSADGEVPNTAAATDAAGGAATSADAPASSDATGTATGASTGTGTGTYTGTGAATGTGSHSGASTAGMTAGAETGAAGRTASVGGTGMGSVVALGVAMLFGGLWLGV